MYRAVRGGWDKNIFSGDDVNDADKWGLRNQWLFDIHESVSLLVSGDYSKEKTDCCVPDIIGYEGDSLLWEGPNPVPAGYRWNRNRNFAKMDGYFNEPLPTPPPDFSDTGEGNFTSTSTGVSRSTAKARPSSPTPIRSATATRGARRRRPAAAVSASSLRFSSRPGARGAEPAAGARRSRSALRTDASHSAARTSPHGSRSGDRPAAARQAGRRMRRPPATSRCAKSARGVINT